MAPRKFAAVISEGKYLRTQVKNGQQTVHQNFQNFFDENVKCLAKGLQN